MVRFSRNHVDSGMHVLAPPSIIAIAFPLLCITIHQNFPELKYKFGQSTTKIADVIYDRLL